MLESTINEKLVKTQRRVFHIHVPKTGGTTLNRSLSASERFVNGEHSFFRADFPVLGRVRISTAEWPTHSQMGFLKDDFAVAVIRNPFDWLLSYYKHVGYGRFKFLKHYGWQGALDYHKFKSFQHFIESYCDPDFSWHVPALKNSPIAQTVDSEGRQICDVLLFNEKLDQSLPLLAAGLGINYAPRRYNVGRDSGDYRAAYTADMVDLLCKKLEGFIEFTGYSFEAAEPSAPASKFDEFGIYEKGSVII